MHDSQVQFEQEDEREEHESEEACKKKKQAKKNSMEKGRRRAHKTTGQVVVRQKAVYGGAQLAIEAKNLSQAMKNGNWSDGMNRKTRKHHFNRKKYDVM